MRRVLLTGMSGTGKSTAVRELRARGYKAVDTDDGWCEPLPDGRQQWREDAIEALLDTEDADVLFVAGCEQNQVRFHPRFDLIVLLSAPVDVMVERLRTRTGNPYGKSPAEMGRVRADLAAVEPLLRRVADHEIVTDVPPAAVVDRLLAVLAESSLSFGPARPIIGYAYASRPEDVVASGRGAADGVVAAGDRGDRGAALAAGPEPDGGGSPV